MSGAGLGSPTKGLFHKSSNSNISWKLPKHDLKSYGETKHEENLYKLIFYQELHVT